MYEYTYIMGYCVFVFFLLWIVNMGAPDLVTGEARNKILAIDAKIPSPAWQDVPIIGPIYGFFYGVFKFLDMFYTLLTFGSAVGWISLLIITPMTITLAYIIARLLRGGG